MVISRRTCDSSGIDDLSKGSLVGGHTLDLLDRDASFEPGRAAGLSRLAEFLPRAGRDYQTYRNYDYGPGRHFNVSRLSPYLSTRLIRETEVLEATLRQYSKQEAYKFVQEIFGAAIGRVGLSSDLNFGKVIGRSSLRRLSNSTKTLEQKVVILRPA